ncbi:MAG: hypothetical protein N2606_05715, partial [Candidatus Omnitrophica bacterium]|nr:hypothetical protein [Candidatus Omnitrophota bacterium]
IGVWFALIWSVLVLVKAPQEITNFVSRFWITLFLISGIAKTAKIIFYKKSRTVIEDNQKKNKLDGGVKDENCFHKYKKYNILLRQHKISPSDGGLKNTKLKIAIITSLIGISFATFGTGGFLSLYPVMATFTAFFWAINAFAVTVIFWASTAFWETTVNARERKNIKKLKFKILIISLLSSLALETLFIFAGGILSPTLIGISEICCGLLLGIVTAGFIHSKLQIVSHMKKPYLTYGIFPLAFPLIAGPGVLGLTPILASKFGIFNVVFGFILNLLIQYALLSAVVFKNWNPFSLEQNKYYRFLIKPSSKTAVILILLYMFVDGLSLLGIINSTFLTAKTTQILAAIFFTTFAAIEFTEWSRQQRQDGGINTSFRQPKKLLRQMLVTLKKVINKYNSLIKIYRLTGEAVNAIVSTFRGWWGNNGLPLPRAENSNKNKDKNKYYALFPLDGGVVYSENNGFLFQNKGHIEQIICCSYQARAPPASEKSVCKEDPSKQKIIKPYSLNRNNEFRGLASHSYISVLSDIDFVRNQLLCFLNCMMSILLSISSFSSCTQSESEHIGTGKDGGKEAKVYFMPRPTSNKRCVDGFCCYPPDTRVVKHGESNEIFLLVIEEDVSEKEFLNFIRRGRFSWRNGACSALQVIFDYKKGKLFMCSSCSEYKKRPEICKLYPTKLEFSSGLHIYTGFMLGIAKFAYLLNKDVLNKKAIDLSKINIKQLKAGVFFTPEAKDYLTKLPGYPMLIQKKEPKTVISDFIVLIPQEDKEVILDNYKYDGGIEKIIGLLLWPITEFVLMYYRLKLKSGKKAERIYAAEKLILANDKKAIKIFIKMLEEKDPDLCAVAASSLTTYGKDTVSALADFLKNSSDRKAKVLAIRILGYTRSKEAVACLLDALSMPGLVVEAILALVTLGPPAIEKLIEVLHDEASYQKVFNAASTLGLMGSLSAPLLIKELNHHPESLIFEQALRALLSMKHEAAASAMYYIDYGDWQTKSASIVVLNSLKRICKETEGRPLLTIGEIVEAESLTEYLIRTKRYRESFYRNNDGGIPLNEIVEVEQSLLEKRKKGKFVNSILRLTSNDNIIGAFVAGFVDGYYVLISGNVSEFSNIANVAIESSSPQQEYKGQAQLVVRGKSDSDLYRGISIFLIEKDKVIGSKLKPLKLRINFWRKDIVSLVSGTTDKISAGISRPLGQEILQISYANTSKEDVGSPVLVPDKKEVIAIANPFVGPLATLLYGNLLKEINQALEKASSLKFEINKSTLKPEQDAVNAFIEQKLVSSNLDGGLTNGINRLPRITWLPNSREQYEVPNRQRIHKDIEYALKDSSIINFILNDEQIKDIVAEYIDDGSRKNVYRLQVNTESKTKVFAVIELEATSKNEIDYYKEEINKLVFLYRLDPNLVPRHFVTILLPSKTRQQKQATRIITLREFICGFTRKDALRDPQLRKEYPELIYAEAVALLKMYKKTNWVDCDIKHDQVLFIRNNGQFRARLFDLGEVIRCENILQMLRFYINNPYTEFKKYPESFLSAVQQVYKDDSQLEFITKETKYLLKDGGNRRVKNITARGYVLSNRKVSGLKHDGGKTSKSLTPQQLIRIYKEFTMHNHSALRYLTKSQQLVHKINNLKENQNVKIDVENLSQNFYHYLLKSIEEFLCMVDGYKKVSAVIMDNTTRTDRLECAEILTRRALEIKLKIMGCCQEWQSILVKDMSHTEKQIFLNKQINNLRKFIVNTDWEEESKTLHGLIITLHRYFVLGIPKVAENIEVNKKDYHQKSFVFETKRGYSVEIKVIDFIKNNSLPKTVGGKILGLIN